MGGVERPHPGVSQFGAAPRVSRRICGSIDGLPVRYCLSEGSSVDRDRVFGVHAPVGVDCGPCVPSLPEGGGARVHLIPDFLIAAHASTQANRLAAIDRGYLRRYFEDLELIAP
jgi:hypothetical protein